MIPGYDDTRNRGPNNNTKNRRDGAYYRESWQTAIDRNADAVLIATFNEFKEGSFIEPSQQFGDLYLRLTGELITNYKSAPR